MRERYGPVTVPPDHYFMMGDNRDNSQDSRYWGFLPAHYVKGRALMIYWSFEPPAGEQPAGLGGVVSTLGEHLHRDAVGPAAAADPLTP